MFAILLTLLACDAECTDTRRLSGTFAVFHDVLNLTADGTGDATAENYESESYFIFANGWSRWETTWSASTDSVKVAAQDAKEMMGDPGEVAAISTTWSGSLVEDEENCNAFSMELSGTYLTPQATTHTFTYSAQLSYQGEGVAGTYTYSDTYAEDGMVEAAGSLTNAKGDVFWVAQDDTFDTGF